MKIVILSTYDQKGGAAIAAFRLAKSLNKLDGVQANLLVKQKDSAESFVVQSSSGFLANLKNKWNEIWERFLFMRMEKDPSVRFQFSIANTGQAISEHQLVREADIIHMHWINQAFVSLKEISRLQTLGKPLIWTLHDMWAFTGGEHYSTTESHTEEAGNSEMLKNPSPNDLSHELWKKKKESYKAIDFITCSAWLKSCADKSSLLKDFHIEAIPNPIDTKFFTKRSASIEAFGKKDKLNILFGAFNVQDPRKGFKYLAEALNMIPKEYQEQLNLLIVGKAAGIEEYGLNVSFEPLGTISQSKMPELYSSTQLMLVPSLQDNLPNTIMEAMSCECPVLAFRTGGIPEMIEHGENGYLVEPKSALGISQYLQAFIDSSQKEEMGIVARKKVLDSYEELKVARIHLNHYQKLLDK